MSINSDQLQALTTPKAADTILMANSAGGTTQLSLTNLAKFLAEQDNAVKTALDAKAALSAQETVEKNTASSRHISVAASGLQAAIDALPRLLTEHLYLDVTGTLDTKVELTGFYGSGSISIIGFTLRNRLIIEYCRLPVYIDSIEFRERAETVSDNAGLIDASESDYVGISGCKFIGLGKDSSLATAVRVCTGVRARLFSAQISGCQNAVMAVRSALLSIEGSTAADFQNNQYGAYVWNGGVVFLGSEIPDALGGLAHRKSGGMIVGANGAAL